LVVNVVNQKSVINSELLELDKFKYNNRECLTSAVVVAVLDDTFPLSSLTCTSSCSNLIVSNDLTELVLLVAIASLNENAFRSHSV